MNNLLPHILSVSTNSSFKMGLKTMPFLFLLIFLNMGFQNSVVLGNVVFPAYHKFKGRERTLGDIRAHDFQRHARLLGDAGIPIGGDGLPTSTALYYGIIKLGTPAKEFYVQLDTGSDVLWLNCVGCNNCPPKSELIDKQLTKYDVKGSSSGEVVKCDDEACTPSYTNHLRQCTSDLSCGYRLQYGDGSTSGGYYVRDLVQLNHVNQSRTLSVNESIIFGCGVNQSDSFIENGDSLDGLIGFGPSNISIIMQLAASGSVKKIFSHCFGGQEGSGLFSIGEVVHPKVPTTPLIPDMDHYNINLKGIEVNGSDVPIPDDLFPDADKKGVIIDSGTTLAMLPHTLHEPLMTKIMSYQPGKKLFLQQEVYTCVEYDEGDVNDGFPVVTFTFENSLSMKIYPYEYMFKIADGKWCFGWMSSDAKLHNGNPLFLLGDLVLVNRLVVYDLEKQLIGWTDIKCNSANITVKDEESNSVNSVTTPKLSSATTLISKTLLVLSAALFAIIHNIRC